MKKSSVSLPPQFKKIINEFIPIIIDLRRSLHREPEIGFQEFQTTEKITRFLESVGGKEIERPLPTGVVANLCFDKQLPWIALRAEIDALSIADLKEVPYRSQNPGVCHACGHDVHTAVLCGIAAVLLKQPWPIPVNVRLIFQPAEEPIPSGAPLMIEKDVLKNIQTIWSLHVEPSLSLGTIGLTAGWVNAQSNKLEWELVGKSAHSARPHLGNNPIIAGQKIIYSLQELNEHRWNTADYPVVLVFTGFNSDPVAYNVIPERARLGATLRITDSKNWENYLQDIEHIHSAVEAESGVKIKLHVQRGSPPVFNDKKIIDRFCQNMAASGDFEYVIETDYRSMGGDDFGWYTQYLPGALVRFGISRGLQTPALHTPQFDVPESIIPIAISFFMQQIINWFP